MRKRMLGTLLAAVILLGALSVTTNAANPSAIFITQQPKTPYYPEGSAAIWSVDAWAEGNSLYYRWHIIYEGKDYDFPGDGTEPWSNYAGSFYGLSPDGKSMYMTGIEAGMNGAKVYCVIEDGHDMVKSCEAQVVVLSQNDPAPPEVTVAASLEVGIGEPADLYCSAVSPDGSALEYQWYETGTGELKDIRALTEEQSDTLPIDTSKAYSGWYVCMVTTANCGRTYTNPIRVVVSETNDIPADDPVETLVGMEITTLPTKRTYRVGEKADLSGIRIRVYTDMGFLDVTDSSSCVVKPAQFTTPGDIEVTVQYMDLTATYTVNVTENDPAPVITTQTVSVDDPASVIETEKAPLPVTMANPSDISSSEKPENASEDIHKDQIEQSIPAWLSSVLFAVLGAAVCGGVIGTVLLLKKRKNK